MTIKDTIEKLKKLGSFPMNPEDVKERAVLEVLQNIEQVPFSDKLKLSAHAALLPLADICNEGKDSAEIKELLEAALRIYALGVIQAVLEFADATSIMNPTIPIEHLSALMFGQIMRQQEKELEEWPALRDKTRKHMLSIFPKMDERFLEIEKIAEELKNRGLL